MYLLDTDTCIYLLNGKLANGARRLAEIPADQVGSTAITAAELRFGALNSGRVEHNLSRVETFLAPLHLIVFGRNAVRHFADIKLVLRKQGQPIGLMDMLIAACCLSADATLVTNNLREFSRVLALRAETWAN